MKRCPIIYRGAKEWPGKSLMCFGFECGSGWFEMILLLSESIERIASNIRNKGDSENGWVPVVLLEAGKISKEIYEFMWQFSEGEKLVLFVSEKDVEEKANLQHISDESLCYLKRGEDGGYQMSLFSDDMIIMDSTAFLDKKRLN